MSTGGEASTLLTTDPSPDVAPIHDRQMVVLERSDWSAWLEQTGNEGDLLRALPAGTHVMVHQLNAIFETVNYHFRRILRSSRVSEDHDRHFQMRPIQ
jgi:putative SOS response-associated peptidase YedK